MYICICKGVTDGQIRKAVLERGVKSMRCLRRELGGFDQCGKCGAEAKDILKKALQERTLLEQHALPASRLG